MLKKKNIERREMGKNTMSVGTGMQKELVSSGDRNPSLSKKWKIIYWRDHKDMWEKIWAFMECRYTRFWIRYYGQWLKFTSAGKMYIQHLAPYNREAVMKYMSYVAEGRFPELYEYPPKPQHAQKHIQKIQHTLQKQSTVAINGNQKAEIKKKIIKQYYFGFIYEDELKKLFKKYDIIDDISESTRRHAKVWEMITSWSGSRDRIHKRCLIEGQRLAKQMGVELEMRIS